MRGRRPSPSAKFVRSVSSSASRGAFVHLLGLAQHAFELGADNVDVDAHARVLERDQPDPQGALDESRPIVGRAIGERRGERRVVEHEAVHDDPVAQHLDAGRRIGGRRERDERSGFHGPNGARRP